MLREASNINRSLFVLGKVISALGKADREAGEEGRRVLGQSRSSMSSGGGSFLPVRRRRSFIQLETPVILTASPCVYASKARAFLRQPYRDSLLTKLLMDSLGERTLVISFHFPSLCHPMPFGAARCLNHLSSVLNRWLGADPADRLRLAVVAGHRGKPEHAILRLPG